MHEIHKVVEFAQLTQGEIQAVQLILLDKVAVPLGHIAVQLFWYRNCPFVQLEQAVELIQLPHCKGHD